MLVHGFFNQSSFEFHPLLQFKCIKHQENPFQTTLNQNLLLLNSLKIQNMFRFIINSNLPPYLNEIPIAVYSWAEFFMSNLAQIAQVIFPYKVLSIPTHNYLLNLIFLSTYKTICFHNLGGLNDGFSLCGATLTTNTINWITLIHKRVKYSLLKKAIQIIFQKLSIYFLEKI
jgi:hypothetical protein